MLAAALAAGRLPAQEPTIARDPFPARADGFGPGLDDGLRYSRWAEDWNDTRAAGTAPLGKAMRLADDVTLTLSAETRVRADRHDERDDELLWRGVLGADLHFGDHLRAYGELASGQVLGGPDAPAANFDNDAAVSQAFVDVHGHAGELLLGAMLGRQEFADGPRQLISLSDGPNLHRTWNGVRLYLHGARFRISAHELLATGLQRGTFDERVDDGERLRGANASLVLSQGVYLDPFWLHGERPLEHRDTFGTRLWGRVGDGAFDWTCAHQSGRRGDRHVDAWGLFTQQSLPLGAFAWRPRLTLHIDVASGGGGEGHGSVRTFDQLYASSSYLGEGRLLSLANLILCAPGLSVSPSPTTRVSIEYGFARRFARDDSVYGAGMRAYPGTAGGSADDIGGLLRVEARWSGPSHFDVSMGYERLQPAAVLERAGLPGGDYAFLAVTVRF